MAKRARRPRRKAAEKTGAKAEVKATEKPAGRAWDRLETGLPSRRDWSPAPKKDFGDE